MAQPVIDWNVIHSFGVDQLIDLLGTNHRFLVESVVRNNQKAVAQAMGITERMSPANLTALVLAMDEDEQAQALNVEYITGKIPDMDEAFGIMYEETRDAAVLGDGGPSRFIVAAVTGLAAVASAFMGTKNAKAQAESEANAVLALAEQQRQAEQQAKGRAIAKANGLRKAAPWIAAVLLCLVLAIIKLKQ